MTKPSVEVAESDVDEWIERLREQFAEPEPADRPVNDGDFVTVDVEGAPATRRSTASPGATTSTSWIEPSSGSLSTSS